MILFEFTRKKVKNINLRVRRDQSVCVSASPRVPLAQIDAFVAGKAGFIARARARIAAAEKDAPDARRYVSGEVFAVLGENLLLLVREAREETVFCEGGRLVVQVRDENDLARKRALAEDYYARLAARVFPEALARMCAKLEARGVVMPKLRIRNMKTRWGSCLVQKGIVTLNARLVEHSMACIEYVAAHELCHFVRADHSRRFYELLAAVLPDWKERKALLNGRAGNPGSGAAVL